MCQYYFFSISFRHKTEHMGPLWYVLRVIPTYLVNLICQKRKLFRQILVIWVKIIYIFSMFSFALRPVWSEKNAYRFFINVSLFWIMQKTCLWNYALFSWNTRHHHICTCEFCLRHDFWIYGFSKIWHYGIHFRKTRKKTFFLHEPNECVESTGHSNWSTFHTVHICIFLCLNEPLKEKKMA